MSKLGLLIKTMLKNQYTIDQNKKRAGGGFVAAIIIAIIISVMTVGVLIFQCSLFVELGLVAELATAVMLCAFVYILIYGTISLLSVMFSSKDTEFLLSLPVSSTTIFFAKLIVVYVMNLLVVSAILVPGLITVGVLCGQGILFYAMILVATLFVPLFPLLLSSLFVLPVMFMVSKLKNKGLVGTILAISLMSVGLCIYFLIVMQFNNVDINGSVTDDASSVIQVLQRAASFVYPLYSLSRFMTMSIGLVGELALSMLIDMGIFVVSLIIVAILAYIMSGIVYKKASKLMLENDASVKVLAKEYRVSTASKALFKKEVREVLRNSSIALQCCMGIIMCPILCVVFSVIYIDTFAVMASGTDIVWIVLHGIIFFMIFSGMVYSQNAVSIDGKSFSSNKYIPVDYTKQVNAKKKFAVVLAYLPIVLSVVVIQVIMFIVGNYNVVYSLLALVTDFVFVYGLVCLNMYFDLSKPVLSWVNPLEVLKGTKTLKVMLINMAVSIVTVALMVVVYYLGFYYGNISLFVILAQLVVFVIGLSIALPMQRKLAKNAQRLYERIEV